MVLVYTSTMSRRMHVQVTERQYALLLEESARTGLPMTELIRRGIDVTLRPLTGAAVLGYELELRRRPERPLRKPVRLRWPRRVDARE